MEEKKSEKVEKVESVEVEPQEEPQPSYEQDVHPRILYLRKLYFMLFVQLTLIGIICYVAWKEEKFKKFLIKYNWIFYLSISIAVVLSIFVLVAKRLCEKTPLNWLLYILFTVSLCFVFANLVSIGNSNVALMVFIMADAIAMALFIYALTTKIELTYQGATMFVLLAVLIVLQIFIMYTSTKFHYIVYVSMGECIFAFFLIYQTQTIISGSPIDWNSDWVSASIREYSQVIILILKLCELIRQVIIRERS